MSELYKLTAHELKAMIAKKEVKVEEVTNSFLDRIEKVDDKTGAFLYVAKEQSIERARELDEKLNKGEDLGLLGGVPVAIKDNISVKGMQNTCGSKILEGYAAPYDSHAALNLKKDGAVILGKLNMDEFAMGSSNETSAYKLCKNPWDLNKVPGGSSGGAAAAVAAGEAPLTIGTETGGSVRQPASLCGVVGLKPTYGRISRYGVVAFGSTLDQIGPLGKDVEDCALMAQSISGYDKMDSTTYDIKVDDYISGLSKDIKGKRIGIPKEYFGEGLNPKIQQAVYDAVKVLEKNGAVVKECSLPLSQYSLAVYYIVASAEASSNLARFDGIRYGYRTKNFSDSVDIYHNSRSEGFGKEVKRRIMLGTYALSAGYYDAYYKKALKVRNLIKQDFDRVFKDFDAVISPTSPTTAFNIGERMNDVLAMYMSDIYTVPVNIAGIPAISVPCGMVDGLPIGLQFMTSYFREDLLFNLAYSYEQATEWHKLKPEI